MGVAVDSLKRTFGYVFKSRDFLVLALVLAVFYFVGDLFVSLFTGGSLGVLLSLLLLLVTLVVSFFLACVVFCLLRTGSLSEAFTVLPKYIVNLFLAEILIFFIIFFVVVFFLVLLAVASWLMGFHWFFGALLMLSLIVVGFVSLVYVSSRLYLTSPYIVFKDFSLMDSLRNSWGVSEGKVSIIFFASFALSVFFMILFGVLTLINLFVVSLPGGGLLSYPVLLISSFVRGFYSLSSTVLSVMLFRGISGHKRK